MWCAVGGVDGEEVVSISRAGKVQKEDQQSWSTRDNLVSTCATYGKMLQFSTSLLGNVCSV